MERDRKEREDKLILALLLLSDEAEAAAIAAYRRGDDPGAAVRDAFYIPDVGPGASTALTQAYAGAYRSAVKVAGQIAGTKTAGWKAPTETDPAGNAKTIVDSIVAKVQAVITQGMTAEQVADAIGQAFDAAGVTKEQPHTLDAVAATQINAGYQPGLLEGWMQSPNVTGFRFKIIDDGRNTKICLARKNVQLPKRHPWWKKNVAPLHWKCRSTIICLTGSFVPTTNPPTDPPPQSGFGVAPSFMLSRISQPVLESFDLAADAGGIFRNIGGHTVFISGGMITGAKEGSEHLKGKTVADAHDAVAGEHEAKAAEHKQWVERFARARDGRTANKHSDIAKEHANAAIELRNTAKMMRGETGPMMPLITHAYLSRIAAPELESLDLDRDAGELTGGEWRTIRGARVYIKDGVAIAGPKGLVGEKGTPNHLIGKSENEIASHGAAPEKKEGFHSIERDAAGAYKGGNAEHEARLKGLKIAPGYTHIHLAEDPAAKLQATYRDSKGRAQYKYSAEHSGQASADKFARADRFAKDMPGIREKIANDPSEEAAALRLIAATGLRVGGSSDTGAEKQAYGATTLESQHVTPSGNGGATLKFTGKKGVDITHEIADPDVAKEVLARAKSGGKLYNTTDAKTRDFLHKVAPGTDYKVKDFRTHVAATTAKEAMKSIPAPTDEKSLAAGQKKVAEVVAAKLGNTPAIAIKDYIPPEVFAPWHGKVSNLQQADLISKSAAAKGITPDEAAKQWIPKHAASFRTDYKSRHKVTGKASKLNEPAFLSRGSNGNQHPQSEVRDQSRNAGDVRHGFIRPRADGGRPQIGGGGSGSGGPRRRIDPPVFESYACMSRIPWPEWESDVALTLSSDDSSGRWVTIDGTHVLIRGGKIVEGPAALKGKTSSEAHGHAADARDRDAAASHRQSDAARKSGNRAEEEKHSHIAKFHKDKANELRQTAKEHESAKPTKAPDQESEPSKPIPVEAKRSYRGTKPAFGEDAAADAHDTQLMRDQYAKLSDNKLKRFAQSHYQFARKQQAKSSIAESGVLLHELKKRGIVMKYTDENGNPSDEGFFGHQKQLPPPTGSTPSSPDHAADGAKPFVSDEPLYAENGKAAKTPDGNANASDPATHTAAVEKHVTSNLVGGASTKNDFRNSAQFGADKKSYPPDVEHSLRQSVAAGHIEAIPRDQYPGDNPTNDHKLINIGGKAIRDFRLTSKGRDALEGTNGSPVDAAHAKVQRFLDNINSGKLGTPELNAVTDHLKGLSKDQLDELLPRVGIAGKAKSKGDAIDKIRTQLANQLQMHIKVQFSRIDPPELESQSLDLSADSFAGNETRILLVTSRMTFSRIDPPVLESVA